MAALSDIRAGLAANLASISGVQINPYQIGNPSPPYITIRPNPDEHITYHQAMGDGLEYWHLIVEAYVGMATDKGAQVLLDSFVESTGATSVKAAIESDQTLGGIAQGLVVEDQTGYAEYARPDGTSLLGCRWHVQINMDGG